MAERKMEKEKEEEEARPRKKAQPVYDQRKQAAEPEESREKQASLVENPQIFGAQTAEAMLGLQQTYGNAYVQRLLSSRAVQAKLTVNPPDDLYEKEADRVAEVVAQTPQPKIQRQEEEEEKEEGLQMKAVGSELPEVSGDLETRIKTARGSGQPLSDSVRASLEPQLGRDLSDVRVHTDAEADSLSQQLGARAFTTGHDVFFKEGAYQPDSESGKKLLGHEMTHVVQQEGKRTEDTAAGTPAIQKHPDDGGGKTSLSFLRGGKLGLHLTINAPPPPSELVRVTAPFRERGVPMTDRDIEAITSGLEKCEKQWTELLQPILGPRSGEFASWIATQTYTKAIESTLKLENPTVLEEAEKKGEKIGSVLRTWKLPAAKGESVSGGALDLLKRVPLGVGFSLRVYW